MNNDVWRSRVLAKVDDSFTVNGVSGGREIYESSEVSNRDILNRLDIVTWDMFKSMFPNDYAPESLDYTP